MKIYMAPMEGLTGYIYRNAYQKFFHNVDRYFTPFIASKKLNSREKNDILPEHNQGMDVVPQILANRADEFLAIAAKIAEYGYPVVNLNLGCPSGTVTARKRGAGFLGEPEELERFLDEIFEKCPLKISIKTRIGKDEPEEWERILALYEKYPLEELIIHPRIQKDFYQGKPRLEAFVCAQENSRHSLCYNGDIETADDYRAFCEHFPQVDKIMVGRGILKNPMLIGEIQKLEQTSEQAQTQMPEQTAEQAQKQTKRQMPEWTPEQREEILFAFHEEICQGYQAVMSGDKNTLYKMKELWFYLGQNFTEPQKYLKKIKKAQRLTEYEAAVRELFRNCSYEPGQHGELLL